MARNHSKSLSKSSSSSLGMVYAIACGDQPGIYFHWEDSAEKALRGIANPLMEQFPSIAEAQRFLQSHGFEEDTGDSGWLFRARAPMLFTTSGSNSKSKNGKKQKAKASTRADPRSNHKEKRLRTTTATSTTTTSSTLTTGGDTTSGISTTKLASISDSDTDDHHDDDDDKNNVIVDIAKDNKEIDDIPDENNHDDDDDDDSLDLFKAEATAPSPTSPPPLPSRPEYKLDACQQRAIDAASEGRNVFLTGVAGTGKSLVTKLIYQQAVARYSVGYQAYLAQNGNIHKAVALCAPTGMAAVGLGAQGQTIHSFAGVKVPFRASDFQTMFSRGNTKKWQTVQCLIMDEVGMVSADFLDWLDVHVRQIRHRPLEPFGGIQLIFVGDFAQLGPVPGSLSLQASKTRRTATGAGPAVATGPPYPPEHAGADCLLNIQEMTAFAFQTALWREAKFCHVHLTQVYRQSDRTFVQALMDLRQQRPDTELVQDFVQKCSISLDFNERQKVFGNEAIQIPEGLLPTLLYTNNRNADRENAERLASLTTEHKRFVAQDSVHVAQDVPPTMVPRIHANLLQNKFFEQCQANKFLDLKVGAQVMLVQNLSTEQELINGSRGVVERFRLVPVVTNVDGTEERLIGPEDVEKYPGYSFEQLKFGMTLRFEDMTWKISKFEKYPLVRFLNNRTKIILPTIFERTLFDQGKCSRVQLPLRLSWALTIHKAQGCTLDWLICDLAGCFTAGQAYVALSRAKTMAGLQIRNFSTKAFLSNPLVDRFYQALKDDTIDDFLRNEAGLWWYPILDHPDWLNMFLNASQNYRAQGNSTQFRLWVANYKPPAGYQGWMGYSDCTPMVPVQSSYLNTSSNSKPRQQYHRLVTPTNSVRPTLSQGGQHNPIEL